MNVMCFNCRSIVPHWKNCANCAAPFSDLYSDLQMDPHLRRLSTLVEKYGIQKFATSAADTGEISVIARVTNLDAFKALAGVRVVTSINPTATERNWIVTARIPIEGSLIEEIRRQPFVLSLKASRRLRPSLEETCKETLATAERLPSGNLSHGGKGVIIGIIDFGLDFQHKNFRNPDGTSRILALWDQRPKSNPRSPSRFGYGSEYRKADIDAALQTAEPEATLQYRLDANDASLVGVHATAVADVAAGNGRATGCSGTAPQADIVFVELSIEQIPRMSPKVLNNSFGDTRQLLEAVQYIFDFAGDRPCVINISLATNGGPHDGSTLVEAGIDRLVSEAPNRAVVIAAGNFSNKNTHAVGKVLNEGTTNLKWQIPAFDPSSNELEIWYSGKDRFTLNVINPQNEVVLTALPGEFRDTRISGGILTAHNRLFDPGQGDNSIDIFFDGQVPEGIWTVALHGDSVVDGTFHAWIERDEIRSSQFVPGTSYTIDNTCTIGSISCGEKTITVGAYDAHQPNQPLLTDSSAGTTRDNRKKPELSAPGGNVFVAQALAVTRGPLSGTSLSAPAVTGIVALMLAEAKSKGISLTSDQIREILINKARKEPPAASAQTGADNWDPRYGYGRVSAEAAVAAVMAKAAGQ
jgi:subtilisin family serine protease